MGKIKLKQMDIPSIENHFPNNEVLKEKSIRTMVFNIATLAEGVRGTMLSFPYDGNIIGLSAYCAKVGSDDTQIEIEKISQENLLNNDLSWESIHNKPLTILANHNIDNKSYGLSNTFVNTNDFFRVNILKNGHLINLTINILVQI